MSDDSGSLLGFCANKVMATNPRSPAARIMSQQYHRPPFSEADLVMSAETSSQETSGRAFTKCGPEDFVLGKAASYGIGHAPKRSVYPLSPKMLIGAAVLAAIASSANANPFPATGPTVPGKRARLRLGQAAAPEGAPLAVKRAIWAANQLHRKPYVFGGGHKSFADRGYDCSRTVSYALGAAGLLKSPISSSEFRKFGEQGRGKWITIYACNGHTYAIIARLRLDTTPCLTAHDRWAPGWQATERALAGGFEARHPIGL